ncbi:DUF6966 domain-containing protein [Yersinia frederiksenii]|uniref:DUF6966 domain-containing protein n=1 Tax=Yersinia frederiksenii TaxID=29484 RepID=UPI003F5118C4
MADKMSSEPETACHDLLRLYGGMGSLNDLLIYKDGVLLINENEELDQIRSELFNLLP